MDFYSKILPSLHTHYSKSSDIHYIWDQCVAGYLTCLVSLATSQTYLTFLLLDTLPCLPSYTVYSLFIITYITQRVYNLKKNQPDNNN